MRRESEFNPFAWGPRFLHGDDEVLRQEDPNDLSSALPPGFTNDLLEAVQARIEGALLEHRSQEGSYSVVTPLHGRLSLGRNSRLAAAHLCQALALHLCPLGISRADRCIMPPDKAS
jgi:hypothetical protein